ncbi:MAG: extracellular solute-binding protein [Lachnospiraceae bacterium]|nr:extracellular solute-binding protein [Lachnospiraceae bacterium]
MSKAKMLKKRIIALGLAAAMVGSMAGCGNEAESGKSSEASSAGKTKSLAGTSEPAEEQGKDLSWLNVSTETMDLPIVAEGTEKKLTIWYTTAGGTEDPEQTWSYLFAENGMNIDLEVLAMNSDNRNELLTTAFASGDLPDIIVGSGFSTAQLVKYGALEEQLLDLTPYLNETFMPNLTALCEETSLYKDLITDQDGHVWSVPLIGVSETPDGLNRMYLNYDWLEEVNMEVPRTTDEFLEVMRAFKAVDESRYPVGGSYSYFTPTIYLLNAFGYVGNGAITDICLRNGEIVMPAADREAYGAFLEYCNTLYEEGLIHPDFFTMDSDTMSAQITGEKAGFFAEAIHLYQDEEAARGWWGAYPLTSEYNDTCQWPIGSRNISPGGAIVTSACEEPELAAVFLDWFFNADNYMIWSNMPLADEYPEYLFGYQGHVINEEGNGTLRPDFDYDQAAKDKYGSGWKWACNHVHMWFTRFGLQVNQTTKKQNTLVDTSSQAKMNTAEDRHNSDLDYKMMYYWAMEDTLQPNLTKEVPPMYVYFNAETDEHLAELKVAIEEYATIEMAKFVTGERSLDELDDYFDTIDELGAAEYVQIYADYYASMK